MPDSPHLVLETLALPLGAAALALWMRRGRSPRSRFWVRDWTAQQPRRRVDAEPFFLLWWPVLGAWLGAVGIGAVLMLCGIGPANLDAVLALGGGLIAILLLAALHLASGISPVIVPGRVNLLMTSLYPRWLREERQAERSWVRERRAGQGR